MAVDYVVMWSITLADSHVPTGNTVHRMGSDILAPPRGLQIAQYSGDEGYYLLYLDDQGEEQTDTYHDSVLAAMRQAEFEFGVGTNEWVKS
jgi:hypothetical protein